MTKATQPASRKVEKMMVAMSFSIVSTGASGRTLRPPVPGSWIDVSGRGGDGASSMPLSFTFYIMTRGGMSVQLLWCENTKSSYAPHLFCLLVCWRWDDVALNTRKIVRELFQDLGVSLGRRLMMTWKWHITLSNKQQTRFGWLIHSSQQGAVLAQPPLKVLAPAASTTDEEQIVPHEVDTISFF